MKQPKNKRDLDINIDTKNVDINITRKDGVTQVKVDSPKVDVQITKDSEGKTIKIDSDKVDVTIDKGKVTLDVSEQSGLIGKIAKFILKRFKK